MTIHFTGRMELLSKAYVDAIAASVGAQVGILRYDNQSVDGTFTYSAGRCPKIDFQLKSTYAHDFDTTGKLPFPLSIKNYDDLRSERCTPIILIVLTMPKEEDLWLGHDETALLIRKCAYWKSLASEPDAGTTSSKTVYVDKSSPLSPKVLRELLDKVERNVAL